MFRDEKIRIVLMYKRLSEWCAFFVPSLLIVFAALAVNVFAVVSIVTLAQSHPYFICM